MDARARMEQGREGEDEPEETKGVGDVEKMFEV
jgi:hypothetical protein